MKEAYYIRIVLPENNTMIPDFFWDWIKETVRYCTREIKDMDGDLANTRWTVDDKTMMDYNKSVFMVEWNLL